MTRLWNAEPALVIAVIMAALDVAIVFGLDISEEQKAALIALVTAIGALVTRSQVYSPKTVERYVLDAETVIGEDRG